MQSSTSRRDTSYISLGERRGKSDLARFSLDLSWARAVSDSAHSRAYPSPPMSGSPPLPPRHHPDSSDRGHGSYGSSGQDVFRPIRAPHLGTSEQQGPPPAYPPQSVPAPAYAGYRMEDMPPAQFQYPQQRPHMTPQQQHAVCQPHEPQVSAPYPTPERPPTRDTVEYSSPKQQRKTKGHVASACVPCKRAHLRCDAQRPCSRCLSNGKEDTCVDVQHKKRGRPRLRDERESRYEGLGPSYPHPPPEASMRRPLSLYSPSDASMATGFGDPPQTSGSYRVLKSQGPMGGPMAPRYLDHASPADANIYGGPMPPAAHMRASQEPICAFLTMEMQIAKATQSFGETIGFHPIVSRKFQDIVSANDLEKVVRLQRAFDDERREREPNYLPPIYLKFEEDRVIQSVGFGSEEINQVRADRQDMFTFQGPDGQQRTFPVRFGLAKKESTYFIVLVLHIPATPQSFHQPPSSSYSRESYLREAQYGYHPPQQMYPQNPAGPSFVAPQAFGDPRADMTAYRTSGALGGNVPSSGNMPSFTQTQPRQDYSQGQAPYQMPRSEVPQDQMQRQHDLQLPPIRDQLGEGSSMDPMRRRDDRSGRVDIDGLIERPGPARTGA